MLQNIVRPGTRERIRNAGCNDRNGRIRNIPLPPEILFLILKLNDLKEKLEIINKYDKVGLKELFRKSLSGQTISYRQYRKYGTY